MPRPDLIPAIQSHDLTRFLRESAAYLLRQMREPVTTGQAMPLARTFGVAPAPAFARVRSRAR